MNLKNIPTAVVVSVVGFATVCVLAVALLLALDRDPDKLTIFIGLLVPQVVGFLQLGGRLGDVQKAVNGQLTDRLDAQTDEIVRKVPAEVARKVNAADADGNA